jgi:hypothetical protein
VTILTIGNDEIGNMRSAIGNFLDRQISLRNFLLIANDPLPAYPLPVTILTIGNDEIGNMRSPIGNFLDKWWV